ncbi:precorrin-3B C(17)-methyltransferase [Aneurinibacillus sp. Ricciae_BoGa-3]|uniref:precorrin-3B C(17)-methyltransferase n=1 Tax=Aneurinibacillus sp. Ricciae_BoGa-3 TaxID=3022697 RepID=UPI0023400874|nr:precorrin-3B C(17)-methyltransferase [Aneurinibacillus sp. Ricciae_BoGa-3]WCK56469.1 precorrin-3B C(17)-methyltransferase [Aneurinibacillus sp. Ricciae_BoGa-3]
MPGKILVVGFGPGSIKHFTERAREAIQESDCIIGYKTYVDLVLDVVTHQEIISTGMAEEVSRAQAAVKLAESGRTVAVISSGDAGVYGMAGLVYEVLIEQGWTEKDGIEVEVIPGISAINSCASLLGAPVMHDACTISLSDHLTPWDIIAKRIEAAASADFVIAIYNPKSGRRTRQIVEARNILLQYRSPRTPVGLVKSAYRDRQQVIITTIEDMLDHDIGMLTTIVIGNSTTFLYDNKMITPRGYQRKYTLNAEKQALRPHERLRPENEPWALHGGKEDVESPLDMAMQAVAKLDEKKGVAVLTYQHARTQVESIFELAVSPGVANKKFTPDQLILLAEIAGEKGSIEYTPHHQIVLRIPSSQPEAISRRLREAGFLLSPIGDVLTVKACDFCDGEKKDGIPFAEEIQRRFGGIEMPKELMLGFNGCAMACYGAVKEDIGIVFRRGKFDLFLGAKTVGRTAQAGQPVAEGIEPDKLVPIIEAIIHEYKEKGYPNERFHKFFKRVKTVQGYQYQDETPKVLVEAAPCGD